MRPLDRVWLVCLISAGVLVAALLLGCAAGEGHAFSGAHYNQGANAAWLGNEWVSDPHESNEIASLAQDLARRQIRVVYVFCSYRRPDGEFSPNYRYAAQFIRGIKSVEPALSVQAWIGLPLASPPSLGRRSGGVDLNNPSERERIVAFAVRLAQQHGFDGVHLDPEPVADDDPALLALLDEMRRALGPRQTLSIATRRIWPFRCPMPRLAERHFWGAEYYREVAARVDQIALMTYDSALPLPQLYRLWGRLEAIAVTRALLGTEVALFVGIPTSEEKTWTHWPNAENMASGLLGLIDGLNDSDAVPHVLTGVAIYPYWETDEAEWETYSSLWLGD